MPSRSCTPPRTDAAVELVARWREEEAAQTWSSSLRWGLEKEGTFLGIWKDMALFLVDCREVFLFLFWGGLVCCYIQEVVWAVVAWGWWLCGDGRRVRRSVGGVGVDGEEISDAQWCVSAAGRQDMAVAVTVGGESVVAEVGRWNAPDRGDVFRAELSLLKVVCSAAVLQCAARASETRCGQTCKKVELRLGCLVWW